jgi:hypothetical protein
MNEGDKLDWLYVKIAHINYKNVYCNIKTFEKLEININELDNYTFKVLRDELVITEHEPDFMKYPKELRYDIKELYNEFIRKYQGRI